MAQEIQLHNSNPSQIQGAVFQTGLMGWSLDGLVEAAYDVYLGFAILFLRGTQALGGAGAYDEVGNVDRAQLYRFETLHNHSPDHGETLFVLWVRVVNGQAQAITPLGFSL